MAKRAGGAAGGLRRNDTGTSLSLSVGGSAGSRRSSMEDDVDESATGDRGRHGSTRAAAGGGAGGGTRRRLGAATASSAAAGGVFESTGMVQDLSTVSGVFELLVTETLGLAPYDAGPRSGAVLATGLSSRVLDKARDAEEDELYADNKDVVTAKLQTASFERTLTKAGTAAATATTTAVARPTLGDGLGWSKSAPELAAKRAVEVVPAGATSQYASRDFLYGFFKDLRVPNVKLRKMDSRMMRFLGMENLILSGNNIGTLENVPPNLVSLSIYANHIAAVSGSMRVPTLRNLGVGFNSLSSLDQIADAFPNLWVLDASFNDLTSLPAVVAALSRMPGLKHVLLAGNPIALVGGYRQALLAALPNLQSVDDIDIPEDEPRPAASEQTPSQVGLQFQVEALNGFVTTSAVSIDPKYVDPATLKGKKPAKNAPVEEEVFDFGPASKFCLEFIVLENRTVRTALLDAAADLAFNGAFTLTLPASIEFRNFVQYSPAQVRLLELPGGGTADDVKSSECIELARGHIVIQELLNPSDNPIVIKSTLAFQCQQLPAQVRAAIGHSVARKSANAIAQATAEAKPVPTFSEEDTQAAIAALTATVLAKVQPRVNVAVTLVEPQP